MFRIPIHNKNYKLLIMAFYMGRQLLPTLLLFLGIGLISAMGLATKTEELRQSPKEIRIEAPGSTLYIRNILRRFHGGLKREAQSDYDWDGDGNPDVYFEARDGTVYSTHSSDHPRNTNDLFTAKFYKHKRE